MTITNFIKTQPQESITIQKYHYPMVVSGPINSTYLKINYESVINKYYSEFRNFFLQNLQKEEFVSLLRKHSSNFALSFFVLTKISSISIRMKLLLQPDSPNLL